MVYQLQVYGEIMIHEKTHSWLRQAKKSWVRASDKYWYKRSKEKYPKLYKREAEVVNDIYERYVYEDLTIAQICNRLKKTKILTPTHSKPKKTWSEKPVTRATKDIYQRNDRTVRTILTDESYIWIYYYNRYKSIPNPKNINKKKSIKAPREEWLKSDIEHVPLISTTLFERAQEKISKKRISAKSKTNYLLSWLLLCDTCKDYPWRRDWMVTRVWNKTWWHKQQYSCKWKSSSNIKKCPCIPLLREELDHEIISRIIHTIVLLKIKNQATIAWLVVRIKWFLWDSSFYFCNILSFSSCMIWVTSSTSFSFSHSLSTSSLRLHLRKCSIFFIVSNNLIEVF